MSTCSCQQPGSVLAAVTAPLSEPFPAPAYPPLEWLTERPEWLTPETKLAVADDGRVAGYFYHAGQCLVHDASACPQPSPTGYAAFHQNDLVVASGEVARVGVIGNTNGHANPYGSIGAAQAHYADPDRQLVVCRAYDDEHGGFILGSVLPTATYGDVALLRRSALSGDWRPFPDAWWSAHGVRAATVAMCEGYDCVGPTLVTRPGLPLVQRYGLGAAPARAAVLGGIGGVQLEEPAVADTVIDLPGGGKITLPPTTAAPVAAPDAAMLAVAGDDPARQAATEIATDGGRLEQRLSAVEETVVQQQQVIEAYTGIVRQLLDAMDQSWAAAVGAEDLPELRLPPMQAASFSADQRDQMAKSGVAMSDGSFPIRNKADLENAVQALGRAKNPDAVKSHIRKRAAALNLSGWLKDHTSWA